MWDFYRILSMFLLKTISEHIAFWNEYVYIMLQALRLMKFDQVSSNCCNMQ